MFLQKNGSCSHKLNNVEKNSDVENDLFFKICFEKDNWKIRVVCWKKLMFLLDTRYRYN